MLVWFSSFGFIVRRLISCFSFTSIIPCRAGLGERCCVILVLSWNILVSPFMVIESFAGYSSQGWYFCYLRVCMTSTQGLLDL